MATTDALIPLCDGYVVPAHVVQWLLAAEDRGLTFQVLADGKLRVRPSEKIHADDDSYIREHRDLLKACVAYCETAHAQ